VLVPQETSTLNTASSLQLEDEIDLRRYRRFLTSHWLVLAGCVMTGTLVGLGAGSLAPLRFQSTATLALGQPGAAPTLAMTPATAKALLANSSIVPETVNELGLNRDGITVQRFIDSALDVQPIPATNLVKLNVTLPDPTKARLAATLLATKVVEMSQRSDRDAAAASRTSLAKRLADADKNLKSTEDRLLQFEMSGGGDAKVPAKGPEVYRRRLARGRLQAEYDARVRFYSELAIRYEETPAASTSQFRIVSPAVQPDGPMPRRRRQFATLGGLVGLVCGIVAALAIDGRREGRPVGA
jgi:uncharacterized protein involved in exopolysaccharide biosynthesis